MASRDELYSIYNQLYKGQKSPDPVNELKQTLDWLESKAILLAIVSTQQNTVTIPLLEKHDLDQKFVEISGNISDKAAALRNIMSAYNLLSEQVAYVGDQEGDIKYAKKADCVSIAFCGGVHGRVRLAKMNPNFIIDSMQELKDLPIF